MNQVRLQKFLAEAGVSSRRTAEKIIVGGRITVNGIIISELGAKVDPDSDSVRFDGRLVKLVTKKLYLLHKPDGVITTLADPQGRPSISTLTRNLPVRVFPVGRLDADVTGLLLLTNDGHFAQEMLHPSFEVPRRYLAVVQGAPDAATLKKLCDGIVLDDGPGAAVEARIQPLGPVEKELVGNIPSRASLVSLTVAEGRNHFVKRILKAVGHPVLKLVRVGFGSFELGDLREGRIIEVSFPNAPSAVDQSGIELRDGRGQSNLGADWQQIEAREEAELSIQFAEERRKLRARRFVFDIENSEIAGGQRRMKVA